VFKRGIEVALDNHQRNLQFAAWYTGCSEASFMGANNDIDVMYALDGRVSVWRTCCWHLSNHSQYQQMEHWCRSGDELRSARCEITKVTVAAQECAAEQSWLTHVFETLKKLKSRTNLFMLSWTGVWCHSGSLSSCNEVMHNLWCYWALSEPGRRSVYRAAIWRGQLQDSGAARNCWAGFSLNVRCS
jgi:hypothetical protein